MDHDTAVRIKAPEAYIIGDLSETERDEFEEHFADCPGCREEVWLATAFAANARAVFRDRERQPAASRSDWLAWFRFRPAPALAWSAALNVLLCLGLGYQALRVMPVLRLQATSVTEPRSVQVVPVHSAVRGAAGETAVVVSRPAVVLAFDLPRRYQRYTYSIRPMSGGKELTGEAGPPDTDSLNIEVPVAHLVPGEYTVAASGWEDGREERLGDCRLKVLPMSSDSR